MVFGEPNFFSSLLPWHNLRFWFKKDSLSELLHPEAVLLPRGASIWAMPVSFVDLWKIRAPVHSAEGLRMESFDQLIELSRSIGDDQIEPQPLWEYPCTALSSPFLLFQFDFQQPFPSESVVTRGMFKNERQA
ncbi:hypothetical protein J437_LFUL000598 [Ladona fulva]|uniref:Uncharacterized protein n=1 Tax=Ladona fulva TaxID=123851 RepID=A0A8K0K8H2_LADFU|nr:hypothetical protein J437_LFUL000598 [Ladona fulva]